MGAAFLRAQALEEDLFGLGLRKTLTTLRDATQALRRRRRLLAFGALGFAALVGTVSALLAFAVKATV